MKKELLTSIISFALCGAMALGVAGCGKKEGGAGRNPETNELKLAIGAVDQKFNPLFYTAQNDGEIANMTQASLVTSKVVKDGSTQVAVLAYGNDQPTFALDYLETYYDASGKAIGYGKGDGNVTGSSSTTGSTTYEFVIKKGVKDSMGYDMNVMDVLFNLYVLLDRSYTGSSTLYSTKIKGLQAYRQQDPTAEEGSEGSNDEYYALAQMRIDELIDWSDGKTSLSPQGEEDLEQVKKFYKDELTSDWNTVQTSWVETYKDYSFTAEWQAYLFVEGVVQRQIYTNAQGGTSYKINADGKYLTTLDPNDELGGTVEHQNFIDEIAEVTNGLEGEAAIEAKKNYCINHLYESNTIQSNIKNILTYNTTASTALEYFMAQERSDAMKTEDGSLVVPSISGITVYKSNQFENKYDGNQTVQLDGEYDILRIEIEGVDPKARWNFGITVTPMHYYSDKAHYDKAMAAYNAGKLYDNSCVDFGVECNDIEWFNETVAASNKNGLPVGAGAYKAVSYKWTDTTNRLEFFYNNIAYFARNPYFETLGSGVSNAVINKIQYQVYSDDQIVAALKAGAIDYGTPTATSANLTDLGQDGKLKTITYLTGGYGYVGINPKFVPDIEVRQALMHVFNTALLEDYYGSALVNVIHRPVSTTSWAYPEGATPYYSQWTDPQQVIDLIEESGNWVYDTKSNKMLNRWNESEQLKFTFTLAGQTTDHPANAMFTEAASFLADCGILVTVQTDITALQKLVTGDLAVWAAAWSSSIDPDPYQIYSINSQASSTKNWYKDGILKDATGDFAYEQDLAYQLSDLIDEGRSTLSQSERKNIYARCYDIIMEMAVEFPTYQRYDLFVYNSNVIDGDTLTQNPSYLMGPAAELWKLGYKK